tara:strand:- start:149 stop:559 length:411 start_codon:yes stop_codon:yes gene_type:complete
MLQQDTPSDYVIATGRQESVRRFAELSANALGWGAKNNGLGIVWQGEGLKEVGLRADTGEIVIKIDPRYYRPCDVDNLIGDPSKASKELDWKACITLEELINEMISEDLALAKKDLLIRENGYKISLATENPPNFN